MADPVKEATQAAQQGVSWLRQNWKGILKFGFVAAATTATFAYAAPAAAQTAAFVDIATGEKAATGIFNAAAEVPSIIAGNAPAVKADVGAAWDALGVTAEHTLDLLNKISGRTPAAAIS